ncbi:MAG: hypothetical protein IPI00_03580 [Flavobacteriales bacterium]|nr:hypothetical protein [Flavobacteriales bacterium]MBK7239262.1 hypothetical protein [Flavobacteriales bacterium]MBP9138935.1 hypothetical protein [Flavobacteriales bacterium]HQZ92435.1 hypothetical protein [Flavobacteriales bacterium]
MDAADGLGEFPFFGAGRAIFFATLGIAALAAFFFTMVVLVRETGFDALFFATGFLPATFLVVAGFALPALFLAAMRPVFDVAAFFTGAVFFLGVTVFLFFLTVEFFLGEFGLPFLITVFFLAMVVIFAYTALRLKIEKTSAFASRCNFQPFP